VCVCGSVGARECFGVRLCVCLCVCVCVFVCCVHVGLWARVRVLVFVCVCVWCGVCVCGVSNWGSRWWLRRRGVGKRKEGVERIFPKFYEHAPCKSNVF